MAGRDWRTSSSTRTSPPQVNDVWIMDADGTGKRKLTTHDITGAPPGWTPDDAALLGYDATQTQVYIVAVDGSRPEVAIPANGNDANGSWQRLAP
jgi:Tol biopolymer transport system component